MKWTVLFDPAFEPKFMTLTEDVFVFDPKHCAIVLVAGNKAGTNERRFYRRLITKADEGFDAHLERLKQSGGE